MPAPGESAYDEGAHREPNGRPMTTDTVPVARQPAIFLGHGSPMNAVADNVHTQAWQRLGRSLGTPRAVLVVSAHWYTRGTFVTGEAIPKTIHDFGGFPDALYQIQYPAAGAPALAERVAARLRDFGARTRTDWGLDHGAWSLLVHLYPRADVPVIQLSLDASRPWSDQLTVGAAIAALRDEGVLILGSGGIVHNLGRVDWREHAATPEWATRFDDWVCAQAQAGHGEALADPSHFDEAGRLSVPTPEHYLPLLTVLGTRRIGEPVTLAHRGFELGSLSLAGLRVG
jgi:4,5-DOPA dioxygenase extradiol